VPFAFFVFFVSFVVNFSFFFSQQSFSADKFLISNG